MRPCQASGRRQQEESTIVVVVVIVGRRPESSDERSRRGGQVDRTKILWRYEACFILIFLFFVVVYVGIETACCPSSVENAWWKDLALTDIYTYMRRCALGGQYMKYLIVTI